MPEAHLAGSVLVPLVPDAMCSVLEALALEDGLHVAGVRIAFAEPLRRDPHEHHAVLGRRQWKSDDLGERHGRIVVVGSLVETGFA
jgi:hypothetical protein